MADGTRIEWTDATVNAINGCSVVSPGCTNCYAMRLAGTRLKHHPSRAGLTIDSKAGPVWNGEARLNEAAVVQPLGCRKPRRIFWNAHGDMFHPAVPDEWINRCFAVMALTPQHIHQVLTKRADRMRQYLSDPGRSLRISDVVNAWPPSEIGTGNEYVADCRLAFGGPLPNVWLGVSVEDQARALTRIPELLATPAAVRWLSCEPLLGPVDLREWLICSNARNGLTMDPSTGAYECCRKCDFTGVTGDISWVVAGGESGPGARPMHPDWARSLRDQCAEAGVPFFFKQVGEWGWIDPETHHFEYAAACNGEGPWKGDRLLDTDGTLLPGTSMQVGSRQYVRRVGKKHAGRLLDGVQHDGMPG